jgi:hypothetical protein
MSQLKPIRDLIVARPVPRLTPALVPAFRNHAADMVETYIFTETIREYFDKILDNVARGQGQGFWIQAEYGAGKTHFLVTLAALLSGNTVLWQHVQDEAIRQMQQRLTNTRLFPVVLSLRGEGDGNVLAGRSLLDVLLDEGFRRAIEAAGLEQKIRVTAVDDILNWLYTKAPEVTRADIQRFVQQDTGQSIESYRDNEGDSALALVLDKYFADAQIRPVISGGVRERLAHIYRQLTDPHGPGYTGLLIVIDEYEGWQKAHSSEIELSRDAELLETLGFLLPTDMNYQVYTIVASQSGVPAKLLGGQEGDRFIPLPLLAGRSEHDYDIIISHRTRELNRQNFPEIRDHYAYYSQQFDFARNLDETAFFDIFPFQPRCFEAVRRITSRDLPTARSGLLVFWQVASDQQLTSRSILFRLTDMLRSDHLVKDCLAAGIYKDVYASYRVALEAISVLELDSDEELLARDLLATLFLWYLAFYEHPRRLSLHDLVEATLTTDGMLRPQDNVAYILNIMQALPQIDFDEQSAVFVPAGSGKGPQVLTLFAEQKRQVLQNQQKQRKHLAESMFLNKGLFADYELDVPRSQQARSRNLEYAGEVVIASTWSLEYGSALEAGSDKHFRIVILTPDAVLAVQSDHLQDARIVVVLPGEMNEETRDAVAEYVAWQSMQQEYSQQMGRDAEEVRSWLKSQQPKIWNQFMATHLQLYQNGRIFTRDNLAINASTVFGQGGDMNNRITMIVHILLCAAYPQLPIQTDLLRSVLTVSEMGKVFEGYFDPKAKAAQKAATKNYGVGLELSNRGNPSHFAPQNPSVFQLIETMLTERAGNDLPVWQVFERLSCLPYGLPCTLIQLYILTFVRAGKPRVDLTLKARHGLKLRHGQPLTRDRLTANTIGELVWKPNLYGKFDALVPASGPTWNDTLAYAREITDRLTATTDQVEIEQQTQELMKSLQELREHIGRLRETLKVLEQTFATALPTDISKELEQLEHLTVDSGQNYTDFYERATKIFNDNPALLQSSMQTFYRLRELALYVASISQTRHYLGNVKLRSGDIRLSAEHKAVLEQLNLPLLIKQPELWQQKLRHDFDTFKQHYRNEYQKFHRDYYTTMDTLRKQLADHGKELDVLRMLNQIEGIGEKVGERIERCWQDLEDSLQECPIRDVMDVQVDAEPCCATCQLKFTAIPPEDEVNQLLNDLNMALRQKQSQLASDHVVQILHANDLNELADAAVDTDVSRLLEVVNPNLIELVNLAMEKADIDTVQSDVLTALQQAYPSIAEADIPDVVADFERLLRTAFKNQDDNKRRKHIRITLN